MGWIWRWEGISSGLDDAWAAWAAWAEEAVLAVGDYETRNTKSGHQERVERPWKDWGKRLKVCEDELRSVLGKWKRVRERTWFLSLPV